MRITARAIRRGLTDPATVLRTGWGTTRAAQAAGELNHRSFGPMVIMGVGAGLTADLRPGDLVVGTEVGAVTCASAPLLARVSGIGAGLAQSIVQHRDANGPFKSRKALKQVPRLGPKAFEQSAGFLRITGGDDPLDASGVHPEAYPVVRKILAATKSDIKALIGNAEILRES